MTGRVYLDWNATAPLRPEARAAMIAAMDVAGNPSSVHAEGRAAKALVERAREQVAAAAGARAQDVIFTSGATESAALALAGRQAVGADVEHDAVTAWLAPERLPVDAAGRVGMPADAGHAAVQLANSETGVVQSLPAGLHFCDATQGFGKIPFAFGWSGLRMAALSAHKIGGPKGIGALIVSPGVEVLARIAGGGQEMGRRAGTENVVGIAGFGAAAEAAARDVAAGAWQAVSGLRDLMEAAIADAAPDTIFAGSAATRLPNTSTFVSPGWKGETQVMQMDLAGFAVSAGSACSSGKVRASRVLRAMGFDEGQAASAIRVSFGPGMTEDTVLQFVRAWVAARARFRARAA